MLKPHLKPHTLKKILIYFNVFLPVILLAQHDMPNMSKPAATKIKAESRSNRTEYNLNISDTLVTFASGTLKSAIAVNGTIPAPTLYFSEGDTAIIHVRNLMEEETSVHWHGILLPNAADGVPYLTTPPIKQGETYTFSFPVIQNGTYWYHSHTGLQEQVGLYGPIVIYPKNVKPKQEKVILFSDWTNESMSTVFRSLKANYEWYSIRRHSVQSWGEALIRGYLGDKVNQEWQRMPAMDVSDVAYDAFLANGREVTEYPDYKPGDTILLRMINGGAGSYFWIQFAGGPMTIVAADGKDVTPVIVNKIDFPIAETYDVLITIPAEGAYELRATSADISGYSSVFFGSGEKFNAPDIPPLDYLAMLADRSSMDMDMDMNMDMQNMNMEMDTSMQNMDMNMDTSMQNMDMNMKQKGHDMPGMEMRDTTVNDILSYNMLRSVVPTAYDRKLPVREIPLTLTGNMLRYIWSFDDKPLSKEDKIMIRKGEVVRMKFVNTTMMRHPLHLHGHFFRLINEQDKYSPLKHTFDIKPMETVTIEFLASEEKDWFFHCHILYHMMSGMARIVSYEGSEQNEFAKTGYAILKREDNFISAWFDLSVFYNSAWFEGFVSNLDYQLRFDGRGTWRGDYETETHLLRFLDKDDFLAAFIGYDVRLNKTVAPGAVSNTKDNRRAFEVGLIYLLPFFVESEFRVDPTLRFRFQLQRRDMPITTRLFFDGRVNTDKEYTVGLRYFITRTFSFGALYDSDYGVGAGIVVRY